MGHWLHRQLSAAWETWHEHAHYQARMRGVLARIAARWLHQDLAAGFYAWKENSDKQKRAEYLTTRILLHWTHRTTAAAFEAWKVKLVALKASRFSGSNIAKYWMQREQCRAFCSWSMVPKLTRLERTITLSIAHVHSDKMERVAHGTQRGRRQTRGHSLPRLPRSSKLELIARLEAVWMKYLENYWKTLEREVGEAKSWYDYYAKVGKHRYENQVAFGDDDRYVRVCQMCALRTRQHLGEVSLETVMHVDPLQSSAFCTPHESLSAPQTNAAISSLNKRRKCRTMRRSRKDCHQSFPLSLPLSVSLFHDLKGSLSFLSCRVPSLNVWSMRLCDFW